MGQFEKSALILGSQLRHFTVLTYNNTVNKYTVKPLANYLYVIIQVIFSHIFMSPHSVLSTTKDCSPVLLVPFVTTTSVRMGPWHLYFSNTVINIQYILQYFL